MSSKITGLSAIVSVQPDDVLPVADVHDTSMAATGTTKKIKAADLLSFASDSSGGLWLAVSFASPWLTWIPVLQDQANSPVADQQGGWLE